MASRKEVLRTAAGLLEEWPSWPAEPVSAALAQAAGAGDAAMWADPVARDTAEARAAGEALVFLAAYISTDRQTTRWMDLTIRDGVRISVDAWAQQAAERGEVLRVLTEAALAAPERA